MRWILLIILLLPNENPIIIREEFPGGRECGEAKNELFINEEEIKKRKGKMIIKCIPSMEEESV